MLCLFIFKSFAEEEEEKEETDSNNNNIIINNKNTPSEVHQQLNKTKPVTATTPSTTPSNNELLQKERAERRASRRRQREITAKANETKVTIETSITTDRVTTSTEKRNQSSVDKITQAPVEAKKTDRFSRVDSPSCNEKRTVDDTKEEAKDSNSFSKADLKQTETDKSKSENTETKSNLTGINRRSFHDRFNKDNNDDSNTPKSSEKKPVSVVEEKIEARKEKQVKSANTGLNKDNNASKFESRKSSASKQPQSMMDAKSKFELKSTSDNTINNKGPISMNIRQKFEKDATAKPVKFELRKTPSVQPLRTNRTTRDEKNENGIHTEISTTKTNLEKGEGVRKQEIKEVKTVERRDTKATHAEKTTTINETKTAGGMVTLKKTETKFESKTSNKDTTKPVLKKTGSNAAKSKLLYATMLLRYSLGKRYVGLRIFHHSQITFDRVMLDSWNLVWIIIRHYFYHK